jgi:serine phosphatase RsbU (regulator of sigma subunit)/CheY-like chemotaxis protein
MGKKYILCVDDEATVLSSLKQELKSGLGNEYSFEVAESGEEGLDLARSIISKGHDLPVVISDQLMPGMKGDQFLVSLQGISAQTRKILLTGQASATAVGNALNNANLYRFISKPWDAEDICLTVKEALKTYYLEHNLEVQNRTLKNINKYSLLLGSEIRLDKWAELLMTNLVKDANSTHGVLKVYTDGEQDNYTLLLSAQNGGQKVALKKLEKEHLAATLAVGITAKVKATKKALIVPNVTAGEWANDPYIKASGIKSVCCIPIQKGNQLMALLYLENANQVRAYENEIVELLNAVVSQSVSALENVLLYRSLEERVNNKVGAIKEDHGNMKDSISFASRIQQKALPTLPEIKAKLPKSFLLFQPRDILSGDFYWLNDTGTQLTVCVADCTGHGVPGAMMSLLGVSFLNQIVRSGTHTLPNEMLQELHKLVITLTTDGGHDSELTDPGMDAAVVSIDRKKGTLTFSGAKRPLLIVRKGEAMLLKYDHHSVGDSLHRDNKALAFTNHEHKLQPGDRVYMFTDGLQDQFGGGDKKKFSYKRLQDLLLQAEKLPVEKQVDLIKNRLKVWQGQEPQTDDILILGFEL